MSVIARAAFIIFITFSVYPDFDLATRADKGMVHRGRRFAALTPSLADDARREGIHALSLPERLLIVSAVSPSRKFPCDARRKSWKGRK
jgi:hypothetical protein